MFGLSIHALQQVRQEPEQGLELAPELVLGLELAQVPERERALVLVPEQEPVRVLVLGQGLVPHMQPSGSQSPPVLTL